MKPWEPTLEAMEAKRLKRMDDAIRIFGPRRQELVARMARDLIRFGAVENEQDSIRSLFGNGYSMVDIVMLIDDARQLAFQQTVDVVAKEIGKP